MRSIPAFLPLLHLSVALLALQGCRTGADVETGGGAATAAASSPSTPPKTLASEPPAFPDPVVDPSRFQEPLTPQCMLLYTQIQGLDAGIPFVLRDLPKTLDELNTDLKTLIGHCRRFLADCPDTPATCSAEAILSRALMVRNARHREEIEKERRKELVDLGLGQEQISKAWPDVSAGVDKIMDDYFREIESLARGVIKECSKGSAERPSNARHAALRVLMDIHNKRWDYSQVRRIGKQIIEEYPRADALSAIHTAIAESYLHEEKFEEAAEYLREVIAQRFEEPEYVIYNNHLFEALSGMGNLDEMEELAHLMRAEYPTRMAGISSNFLMAQYEQWYYNASFWIGFTRFAQGDPAGALQAFEESAQEVDALASQLAPEGKHLNKVIEIYRVLRTEDMIYYLKNEHGKVPEVDFDLGRKAASAALPVTASPPLADATAAGEAETDLWSTREKVTLAESRGKVVLVVFRRTRDARSARFLQKMDQLVKERAKDGLVGLTLGFLVGRGTAADDEAALEDQRRELAELGVTLPAGFDPDRERQNIFRTLHATVGTATFLVFNRKGEHAWYLADPRSMDTALAERVIDRILAE